MKQISDLQWISAILKILAVILAILLILARIDTPEDINYFRLRDILVGFILAQVRQL